ncbi:MAG TPA: hypothetical protein VK864_18715 [Longimicrobiales bacterium]|nr:hypothetical protein [Longimicrobiales bacterium]
MKLKPTPAALSGLLALVLAACTQEVPTDIGGSLLPSGGVRTFEVILEPEQFLVFDTAFSGYADAFDARFLVIARDFEGVLDANTLIRFGQKPVSIQVRDSAGAVRTDTLPKFAGGDLVIRIDTLRSRGAAEVSVYFTTEPWDASSATWTTRIDTGSVTLPWQTPGGTRGARIGSVPWTAGEDTLIIALDSATVFALTNVADTTRGTVFTIDNTSVPAGAQLRIAGASLRLPARSTLRPDTTVQVNVEPISTTFIFTPDPPLLGTTPRVSGVPAWRTVLSVIDGLEDLMLPCPDGTAGCTFRLGDATLNLADLLLRPTGSPPGFSPEDSIRVQAHPLLVLQNVPLSRSPVGVAVGGSRDAIPRTRFSNADNGPEAAVSVTQLIGPVLADTTSPGSAQRPSRFIALLTNPETFSFGFGTFREGPRLRLILTVQSEERE